MNTLDITIEKMPINLQAKYCLGEYSRRIIECMFYNESICLHGCRYSKVMDRFQKESEKDIYKKITEQMTKAHQEMFIGSRI